MIYPGTTLLCKDNSGARWVSCIGLGNLSWWKGAKCGQIIIIVVKTCMKGLWSVQKGDIHRAVILKTKNIQNWSNYTGEFTVFFKNVVALVDKNDLISPIGTWIFGFISKEIWYKSFTRIMLLSIGII